jgi:hypothetical protein
MWGRWLVAGVVIGGLTACAASSSHSSTPPPTVATSTAPAAPAPSSPATPPPTAAPTTPPTTAVGADLTALGATVAQWDAHHQQDPKAEKGSAFLPHYPVGDAYGAVNVTDGRIDGYDLGFAEGTPLAGAENLLLQQLPADTKLKGSFMAKTSDGTGSCLILNYQSATLAAVFGANDPSGAASGSLETINADLSQTVNDENIDAGEIDDTEAPSTITC